MRSFRLAPRVDRQNLPRENLSALAQSLFLAASMVLLSACSERQKQVEHQYLALGTTVSLSLFDPPVKYGDILAEKFEPLLMNLDQRWRSFGVGELGVVNDLLEQQQCAPMSASTYQLIKRALDYRDKTNGLFDPSIGLTMEELGFHDPYEEARLTRPQPPTLTPVQFRFIPSNDTTQNDWKICADQSTRIDLGGIAKGEIVRQLASTLLNNGIENAIINAGGDLLVLGNRGGQPWRIAIQHPRNASVLTSLEAHSGEAFFSSGDYYRFRLEDGQRVHHILDPATKKPVASSMAVTVIHSDPVLADVAATALFVGGQARFLALCESLAIDQALLIDAQQNIYTTTNFRLKIRDQLE